MQGLVHSVPWKERSEDINVWGDRKLNLHVQMLGSTSTVQRYHHSIVHVVDVPDIYHVLLAYIFE